MYVCIFLHHAYCTTALTPSSLNELTQTSAFTITFVTEAVPSARMTTSHNDIFAFFPVLVVPVNAEISSARADRIDLAQTG